MIDRKKIFINTKISLFKIDKFNQYLIFVFNRNIRQNHFKTFQQRAIIAHVAHQSTITYNFYIFNRNCKTK